MNFTRIRVCKGFIVLICILSLTGCQLISNISEANILSVGYKDEEVASNKGRFIERDITPIDLEYITIADFSKNVEDEYLLNIDGITPRGFLYKNGKWVEKDKYHVIKFLENKKYEDKEAVVDFNDNWWVFVKEKDYYNQAYKIDENGEVIEITFPQCEDIVNISVSDTGILAISTIIGDKNEFVFLDTNTGAVIKDKVPDSLNAKDMIVKENYIMTTDATGDNIVSYNMDSGEILENHEFTSVRQGYEWDALEIQEEQVVFINESGIHKAILGGNILQTVINDSSFIYGDPRLDDNTYILTSNTNDKYFVACTLEGKLKVHEYSFDETKSSEKSQKLSIWAYEDSGISPAIAIFSQKYPDCEISVEFGVDNMDYYRSSSSSHEAISKLYERLEGGDAPDILFLDKLSIDMLYEKGFLSTIDIELNESLYYENVINSYRDNDGIYAYPTAFSTYLLATAGSGHEAIEENNLNYLVEQFDNNLLIDMSDDSQEYFGIFLKSLEHKIFSSETNINGGEIVTLMQGINSIEKNTHKSIAEDKNKVEEHSFNSGESMISILKLENLIQASNLFQTHEDVQVIPLFEGTFQNENIVSIPVNAENRKMAEKFINTLLSDRWIQGANIEVGGLGVKKNVEMERFIRTAQTEKPNKETQNQLRYEDFYAVNWEEMFSQLKYSSYEDAEVEEILYQEIVTRGFNLDESFIEGKSIQVMNELSILIDDRSITK